MLTGNKTSGLAEASLRWAHSILVSDPEILGGTPVIKGTRISVYAVKGRLDGGDTIADLTEDYPDIAPDVFRAAALYAKANPMRGWPKGLPRKPADPTLPRTVRRVWTKGRADRGLSGSL